LATVLERWGITAEELTAIVDNNPSLRGVLIGYIGEIKLKEFLARSKRVDGLHKADDHDRSNKNDLALSYKGHRFTIEVKSLQTHTVKKATLLGNKEMFTGKYQCDASDCRKVKLPDGSEVTTTCLVAGEFDIVAVNLFAFRGQWEYGFALNRDLTKSRYKGYTADQQKYLIATLQSVSLPLAPPYEADIYVLLDKLEKEKRQGVPTKPPVKIVAEAT
jgi:hypothetical protein